MFTRNVKIALSCTLLLVLTIVFVDFLPNNKNSVDTLTETKVDNSEVDIESSAVPVLAKADIILAGIKEEEVSIAEKSEKLKSTMIKTIADIASARQSNNVKTMVAVSRGGSSNGFSSFNLTTPSNLTGEQLDKALEGTGLAGLGSAFAEAEQKEGVNALFIAGIAVHESAWGTSDFARNRNNLFGYQAYTNNPNSAASFSSKRECILVVAHALKTNYLTKGGSYFSGYTARDVNKRYAADPNWANKVTSTMSNLTSRLQ